MKWKKILGPALGIAASVATGGLVDPVSGVALASSLVAGKAAKTAGKKIEAAGGAPVQKIAAPAAAIATPVLVLLLAQQLGIDLTQVCGIGQQILEAICGSPAAAGALVGGGAMLLHQVGGGAITAATGRE